MLEQGLVVFSDVDIVKFAYRPLDTEAAQASASPQISAESERVRP
jgi:hypothetical protein